jgi:hypothetical protein
MPAGTSPQCSFALDKRCAASRQLFGPPREPSEVWTIRPRRGHRQDVDAFRTGHGCPVLKPGQASRSRSDGGLGVSFLWLSFFTPSLTALRPSGRLTPFVLRAWTSQESNSATGRSAKHVAGDFIAQTLSQSDARSSDNLPPKPLGPRLRGDDEHR